MLPHPAPDEPEPEQGGDLLAQLAESFAAGSGGLDARRLTEPERDFLLLRVDANLRAFGSLLDEYRPLLDRASRVSRFSPATKAKRDGR